jgi:hypothetical protein
VHDGLLEVGARVLQVTRLAWLTGGEEGKIMKEELEVGK